MDPTGQRKLARGNRAEVQFLLEQVVEVVCAHVQEQGLRVYLFGSWAQGRALHVSDLDIALDIGRPIEPSITRKIAEALEELPTLRKIDLVDLHTVDREFRERVLDQGEVIHAE